MTLYARIRSYVRPYVWPQGVLAVVCMLGFSASEGAVPFLLKYTVDRVLKPPAVVQAEVPPPRAPGPRVGKLPVDFVQRRLDDFVRTYLDPLVPKAAAPLSLVVIGFFVLVQLRGWFDFGAGYLTDWIGFRVVTDLRNQETAHLQRLDHAFFNRQRAGQIVSRVTADASAVRGMVTDVVTSIFQDITRLIMFMGVAVYMDWRLAVIAVGLFPVAAGPLWYFSKQLRLTSRRQQEGTGRLNAMLHENVQGNRVVKAFGQEEYEVRRLRAHNEHLFGLSMRASLIRGVPVTEMLASVSVALILWFGGKSVIDGSRTAGDFFAFLTALVLLYDPFKKLVKANNNIQSGLAGAERVFGLLDTVPHIGERPGAVPLVRVTEGIEFHDVSFAYETGEPVLRHVNLRIPVGQVVALVGTSGGGKTTIADLIPRFYDVTEGAITIDGIDIRDVTLHSLRAQIAVVNQFTFLFNDSVRNNIAYGEPSRPIEDVIAAAKTANAHDFIMELPRGYETHIGDLGVRLSGGQRQRLAIARAVLKNAPILILDEATSALDTESEGLVQEALERLMVNRTTLVVAHRLSTVRRADNIVVIARGEIVESGRHEELLARGAEYRKLYELQFRDTATAEGGAPEPPVRPLRPERPRKAAP